MQKHLQTTIFSHALGFFPELGRYYCSPFRPDSRPGCTVKNKKSWLRWLDYACPEHNYANAWDILAIAKWGHKIRSESEKKAIDYEIKQITGPVKVAPEPYKTFSQDIQFDIREWNWSGLKWWLDYGITESQLREDNKFQLAWYKYNTEDEPLHYWKHIPGNLAFVYVYDGAVKIYRPDQEKGYRKWKTNCGPDHIDFEDMAPAKNLIITGGYKDGRVVKNFQLPNTAVRALQSETQLPHPSILRRWNDLFENIYFLFDIDPGGLKNVKWALNELKKLDIKSNPIYLHESIVEHDLKDIAGARKYFGPEAVKLVSSGLCKTTNMVG